MNFTHAIASAFRKYFEFSGRASRSEYWYWGLFTVPLLLFFHILDDINVFGTSVRFPGGFFQSSGMLEGLFYWLVFIPSLALEVRRLHDVDRSGWWLLLNFTIIGAIPIFVWNITKGTEGANRFGPDPLGVDARAVEVFS